MNRNLEQIKALEAAATIPVYAQLPFLPETGDGCEIITAEGRRILQGRGLMPGLVCDRPAAAVQKALLEHDMLAGTSADPRVLRLLPPLVLEARHVEKLADALQDIGPSSYRAAGKTGTA